MSSIQDNNMTTIGSSEPDYTLGSHPSTSTLERSLNSDDSMHNVPSLRTDTLSSLSGRDDPSNIEERPSERDKLYKHTQSVMTATKLKEMEIRGTLVRPLNAKKLMVLKEVKVQEMFSLNTASLLSMILSKSDGELRRGILVEGNHRVATIMKNDYDLTGSFDFRIPMSLYEIEDRVFDEAWTHCQELKVSDNSPDRSRVSLEKIPTTILNIAMMEHWSGERRRNEKISREDTVVFMLRYLQKTVSDKEIKTMRDHPHQRSKFWKSLEKQGLIMASGNFYLSMQPLYFLLMMPATQKVCLEKFAKGKFLKTNRLYVTACNASLIDDHAVANAISEYPPITAETLHERLLKLTKKAIGRKDSGFIVHESIEQIDNGARCFFYRRVPMEKVQLMITKSLQVLIAEPTQDSLQLYARWSAEQIGIRTVYKSAYGGKRGMLSEMMMMGPGFLGVDGEKPKASSKVEDIFRMHFSGETEFSVHVVTGFYEMTN
ncbi:hypothetical protein GCK72_017501 [Caenorhabditis remanei]|uniref:Uncharacterized protein n=1 Tax=Caenorhabditis remanei TaxID=31234 RepID=A0A6A5G7E5_CAERE|nr:hypothetical protein GCK72_017501 [Caenorhabditis remanei]KAF1750950.1 hypothetical protein GCK72_017501 [Caenorhabditis remanei]